MDACASHPRASVPADNARFKDDAHIYGAAAGIAMLLALLWDGVYPRRMRYALAGVPIGSFSLGVAHNVNAWRSTSQLEARFLSELKALAPAAPRDAEFVFYDMPTTVRGVYFRSEEH